MSNQQNGNAPMAIAEPTQLAEIAPATLSDEQIAMLSQYITSWQQSGATITTMSANGVLHAGQMLGLSITQLEFEESADGKGYIFTAEAVNLTTGQQFKTYLFQSKFRSRNKPDVDPDALAKGSKKVARNAFRGLIPVEYYLVKCQEFIAEGRARESQLQKAQTVARSALKMMRESLMEQFGLEPANVYEIAQERFGEPADWSLAEWGEFTAAIQKLDPTWFALTPADVREIEPEPEPAENDEDMEEEQLGLDVELT